MTDGISMQTKFVHVEMKMKFCLEKSTFSFGLSQKVNNSAPQPKRSVNFNRFSHTFIKFKNIS